MTKSPSPPIYISHQTMPQMLQTQYPPGSTISSWARPLPSTHSAKQWQTKSVGTLLWRSNTIVDLMTNATTSSVSGITSILNSSSSTTPSRHVETASRQDTFHIRYTTLKAMPGTSAQEPIDINLPKPASSLVGPLNQEI